jgi:CRISPR-associated protein Cas5d
MPDSLSRPFRLKLWGKYACFSRPEHKVERVSYPIITPSAARGAIESILWKPQIDWRIEQIDRLHAPVFQQVRRNEVQSKASVDRSEIVIDEARQQRAALVLRDVAYVLHARFSLTSKAGPTDTVAKYVAMFERRARAGQCFQRPCLGSREFAAEFELLEPDDPAPPSQDDRPAENLGWIFYDFDWSKRPPTPRFFEAQLTHGHMVVPPPESLGLRS